MALHLAGWNVVLDSDRADELSAFYERLLGWTWSKRGPPPGSPSSRRMITFRPFGPRRRRSSSKWRIWISTSRMWKKG